MGWTPERITDYEYDDRDRMVRSTEYVESAWNEDERGWMLALADWEASRCPSCGGDPDECQSPTADINNPFGTWVYDAEWVECHRASAARRLAHEPEDRRALTPRVSRRRRGSARSKR
ncbi:hypothetical protein O7626_40085 [Micromonospora sp. WMMD1102]|uniref:hypothetical protein n=1 Tax=Micromonospora sp. WMMD1102 TaxID=3016105 RepID=UPI00241528D1|nr:hypothetical protein [Micromonospora sp. WMMD1102]MDG4792017.1 hypothetical protein [Micromonospora sp. WMMD1102]